MSGENIRKTKLKLVIHFWALHTAVMLATGFGAWYILKTYYPKEHLHFYGMIPILFYIVGLIFILMIVRIPTDKPARIVNLYMMLKIIKIFLSAGLITLFWFLQKGEIRVYAFLFLIFYLIYLALETYIYFRAELFIQRRNKKEPPQNKEQQR